MRILTGEEHKQGFHFLSLAAQIAQNSSCHRSRCGTVIVNNDEIIGCGYNSPPAEITLDACFKDNLPPGFKSDRTCCIHAEQRAMMDALQHKPTQLPGSRLYFIRLDEHGSMQPAGEPYCTICSKMALDAQISEFTLWRPEGICVYDTQEYNLRSFGMWNKGPSPLRDKR